MVQVANLDEQVRESLRNKIISGELAGGFHLSELKLSKEFKVSRTPIREALCSLAADGLIEMMPHRGAFVTDIPQNIRVDQIQTYSLFMSLIARNTAKNGNIELIMDLEMAVNSLADAKSQDKDTFMEALRNVNDMLIVASNSPTLHEAITMVERRTQTADIWEQAISKRDNVIAGYTKMQKAVKADQRNEAETAMRNIMEVLTSPITAALQN